MTANDCDATEASNFHSRASYLSQLHLILCIITQENNNILITEEYFLYGRIYCHLMLKELNYDKSTN